MRADFGSSMVLIAGLTGVLVAFSVAVAGLGLAYSARAQAQAASDAAALAAAVGTYPPAAAGAPLESARQIAEANGARLTSCSCPVDASLRPRVVTVATVVSIDAPVFGHLDVEATSRAEFDPRRWLGR
jgi:secretion/DNA translocation related TadE-like protein